MSPKETEKRGRLTLEAPLRCGAIISRLAQAARALSQVFLFSINQVVLDRPAEDAKMIISKENRRTIYESLFKEGVMVAPKEFEIKHPELDIPNLQVVKACQSLTSKGFVHTQFSWQWYFYTLTDEGLEYLREYLHLPAEIVPATHKRPARPARPAGVAGRAEGGAYRAPRGDRDGGDNAYRKKDQAPSGEFRPRFGGVGRGAPRTE